MPLESKRRCSYNNEAGIQDIFAQLLVAAPRLIPAEGSEHPLGIFFAAQQGELFVGKQLLLDEADMAADSTEIRYTLDETTAMARKALNEQ